MIPRVHAYLALQERASTLFTEYRKALTRATSCDHAIALEEALNNSLNALGLHAIVAPGTSWTGRLNACMLAYWGHCCAYCGSSLPVTARADGSYSVLYHVDHVRPRALGGANDHTNYVPACGPCNLSKGARPLGTGPGEWCGRGAP